MTDANQPLCGHLYKLPSGTVMRCVLHRKHSPVGHHYLAERWLSPEQLAALPTPA